jgi:cytidylate kinase
MALVAITREMGSLGKDVASGLAEALSVPLVYHEIIDHLADRMRVRKSHVIRLLDGSASLLERLTADKTSLSIFTADEIVNLALQGKGAVIRGWGATHLLRDVPHAICVRVCAPFEVRKQRMMDRLGTADEAKVADEIQRNDEAHTAIMRRNFSVQWTDAEHYDVVLNTERVSVKACVDKVIGLVKSAEFAETERSRKRLEDLAMAWRVRAALRLSPRTRSLRVSVNVESGRVTLAGLLDTSEQRTAVSEVAAQAAAGAGEIDDQLRSADAVRPRFQ